MMGPVLTTALGNQGSVRALMDGTVTPEGFSLRFEEVPSHRPGVELLELFVVRSVVQGAPLIWRPSRTSSA